jgi:hypothetical protein
MITCVIGGAVVTPVVTTVPWTTFEASVAVAPKPTEVPTPVPVIGAMGK